MGLEVFTWRLLHTPPTTPAYLVYWPEVVVLLHPAPLSLGTKSSTSYARERLRISLARSVDMIARKMNNNAIYPE